MAKFQYPESDNPAEHKFRAEPLIIPPALCAARLPTTFRRVLDDFAREVLRHQPCDIDEYGARYFGDLVEKKRRGEPTEYQPRTSYIKAQFAPGNQVVVPSEDQNPKGTQTTGSSHYLITSDDEEFDEEVFYSKEPPMRLPETDQNEEEPPKTPTDVEENLAPVEAMYEGLHEDIALGLGNLHPIEEEEEF